MLKIGDLVVGAKKKHEIRSLTKEEFKDGTFHFFLASYVRVYGAIVFQIFYALIWQDDNGWEEVLVCKVLTPDLKLEYFREEDLKRDV